MTDRQRSRDDRTAHADLLLKVWGLRRAGEITALQTLLESVHPETLTGEPELGVTLLGVYLDTDRHAKAQSLEARLEPQFAGRPNDHLHRRFVNLKGRRTTRTGPLADAEALFGELDWMSNVAGDAVTLSWSQVNRGVLEDIRGDYPAALAAYNRALATLARTGDDLILASLRLNMAITYRKLGLYNDALSLIERATYALRPHGYHPLAKQEMAMVYALTGDLEIAESLARSAVDAYAASGNRVGESDALRALAHVVSTARPGDALGYIEAAGALTAVDPDDRLNAAEIQEEAAVIYHMLGDEGASSEARERASGLYRQLGAPRRIAQLEHRLSLEEAMHGLP